VLGLAFQIGGQRYVLLCKDVIEVVPMARLRRVPTAPAHVAGLFTYRGAHTPVVDLCQLITGTPAAPRLSSRIVVTRHGARQLGLAAERVTEAITIDEHDLKEATLRLDGAPWLGRMLRDRDGLTQLIDVAALFDERLERLLGSGGAPA
jgi:chemotaxis-related protein WspB